MAYDSFVCDNPYYVPPDEYLNPDHHEREIKRMLTRMREDTATKEKLWHSEQEQRHMAAQLERERARLGRGLSGGGENRKLGSRLAELERDLVQRKHIASLRLIRLVSNPHVQSSSSSFIPRTARKVDAVFESVSRDKHASCAVKYRLVMPDVPRQNSRGALESFSREDEEGKAGSCCRQIAAVIDVTESVRAEEKLRHCAFPECASPST